MRKIWRISLGIALVVLGIIGGFIPILPGFIFGIPGLIILAEYFPWAQKILDWFKARYAEAREVATASAKKAEDKKRSQKPNPPL
jgi:uncharacterized membrane protein YbaN (DUF454 family)